MTRSHCSFKVKFDRRLLGRWKSDGRRTLSEWRWRKRLTPKKRAAVLALFGKVEVTFTRTIIRTKLKSFEMEQRYEALGVDETSAALVMYGKPRIKASPKHSQGSLAVVREVCAQPRIEHIHFLENHYWVAVGGNREFFRRMRSPRRGRL